MPNDFGAFAPVFESAHGYLALLHLSSDDSAAVVRSIDQLTNGRSNGEGTGFTVDFLRLPTVEVRLRCFGILKQPCLMR